MCLWAAVHFQVEAASHEKHGGAEGLEAHAQRLLDNKMQERMKVSILLRELMCGGGCAGFHSLLPWWVRCLGVGELLDNNAWGGSKARGAALNLCHRRLVPWMGS